MLGTERMSDDELEYDENSNSEPCQYRKTKLAWRADEVGEWLEVFSHLQKSTKWTMKATPARGKFF